MADKTPIWLDEAHTYWVIREGFASVFAKLLQDVHPPLYFGITAWTAGFSEITPLSLRMVSPLAAAGTVLAAYWAARSITSPAWSFGLALFVGTHPVFNYYGYEARNYGLFLLLLTLAAGAVFRAALPTAGRWNWALLVVVFTLLINTHNLAIFTFPPLLFAGMMLAGNGWRQTGFRVLIAQTIAFATYLPWFLTAAHADGGIAWIASFWEASGKWSGPVRSLLGFGVGAAYPEYLGPLHSIRGISVLGAAVTVVLLVASVTLPNASPADPAQKRPRKISAALWLGVGSLVLLWLFSWLYRPIYLVGRYDLVAFPFVALLICIGIQAIAERLRQPALGAAVFALCIGINVYETAQLWTRIHENVPPPVEVVVDFVAPRRTGANDLVITRGQIAFLMLGYAFDHAGQKLQLVPFPAEFGSHPGWYDGGLLLRDSARLQADAAAVARQISTALAEGRRVWLVGDGDPKVDEYLLTELKRVAFPDMANSNLALRVFALKRP